MNFIKRWLLYKLTKGLLPVVTEKDVLSVNKQNKIFLGGEEVTITQLNILQQEAKMLEEMELWKVINVYINNLVSKLVFEKSQTTTDLVVGKTQLYVLNIQNKIIEIIKKAK